MKNPNINKIVSTLMARIDRTVLSRLQFIGEEFVTNARLHGDYKDRTKNLRSSIGYIILRNGEEIFEFFPGEKAEGKATGRKVANDIGVNFPRGWILVCVAGMDYAAYVEAKGRSVITSSAIIAKKNFVTDMKQLIQNINS